VFVSWYPWDVQCLPKRAGGAGQPKLPGLMRSLSDAGYVTAAYMPYLAFPEDGDLHRSEGVANVVTPPGFDRFGAGSGDTKDWFTDDNRRAMDEASLATLKKDLAQWTAAGRRYAVAFMPQIGHAPWLDLSSGKVTTSQLRARGRELLQIQDRWLGELVEVIEKAGRLDKTIILVTADHGVRTRNEDPSLHGGMIEEPSFHVPMVLFAPQALNEKAVLPWVTSHIDIAPSILHLMGITAGRDREMGAILWDDRLRDRVTFFWAGDYLGADGFCEHGVYHMLQHVSGATFSSETFGFDPDAPSRFASDRHRHVVERLQDAKALAYRIMTMPGGKVECQMPNAK
jgi:hypothetical protein